jgi:transposase InsO family protein
MAESAGHLDIQCRYSPIRQPHSNRTEGVLRELAIHEPSMEESAGLFGNPVQVLPYPSPVKQSYRARYAQARNSRAQHFGKRWQFWVSCAGTPLSATRKETLPSALCVSSQFASTSLQKALADLGVQCRYSPIRHPLRNPTERVKRDIAIREPCISQSAVRFVYPVQILPNPPHANQPYRVRFVRARKSRALHGANRWPIWISSAGTPLSDNRRTILPSALYSSTQFASPTWRKALADLGILCGYSPIHHTQSNPTERVMCQPALREHCKAESAGPFGYPEQIQTYPSPAEQSYRARYARARNSQALHGGKRSTVW